LIRFEKHNPVDTSLGKIDCHQTLGIHEVPDLQCAIYAPDSNFFDVS
jgi:hypothetical protein